ncbi:MAG: hypothetical protein IPJ97_13095 [Proteobacteria bacterium]|nr:hypothetical protein [Pseudomonadota bacterium]
MGASVAERNERLLGASTPQSFKQPDQGETCRSKMFRATILPSRYRKFEEYALALRTTTSSDKTDNGVLTARWHTDGKGMLWGRGPHKGIGQLCMDVHQDPDIDVLILGGSGHNYMGTFNPPDPARGPLTPEERYDLEYYDGCRTIEALVGLEQPTIGVINGPGPHTEYAVFCDITLIADHAIISDPLVHLAVAAVLEKGPDGAAQIETCATAASIMRNSAHGNQPTRQQAVDRSWPTR